MGQATERAVLAGGCFWGMQDLIRRRPGVISTRVGYTGGDVANATYRNHGSHAEAIEIVFDPEQESFRDLLEFFFQIHDPTTVNRQGNDVGLSYRSAIFYTDDDQRRIAEDTIADVEASGLWPGKVVTELAPVGPFWEAEPEHQDYLERYPAGYTCHFVRPNWTLPAAPPTPDRPTTRSSEQRGCELAPVGDRDRPITAQHLHGDVIGPGVVVLLHPRHRGVDAAPGHDAVDEAVRRLLRVGPVVVGEPEPAQVGQVPGGPQVEADRGPADRPGHRRIGLQHDHLLGSQQHVGPEDLP